MGGTYGTTGREEHACFGWKSERNRPLGRPGSRCVEKTSGDERIKTGVNFPGKSS